MRFLSSLLIALLLLTTAGARAQSAAPANGGKEIEVAFLGMPNGRSVLVQPDGADKAMLAVANLDDARLLRDAHAGDRLDLAVDDIARPTSISRVVAVRTQRGFVTVTGYMLGALAILLAFGALATGGDLLAFIRGTDKRYSKSKFQMAAWFFLLFTIYIATILVLLANGWTDAIGQIAIPQNLVILSGLSALTYGAAKAITVTKVNDARANASLCQPPAGPNAAADPNAPQAGPNALPPATAPATVAQAAANKVVQLKVNNTAPPSWRDFVRDDEGNVDLGDCQALFITLLALVLYFIAGYTFLSRMMPGPTLALPDVDGALLSIFGLGQGAYLAKKAVSNAGNG